MRQIIINADDFGLSPEISRGILETHQAGIVQATSVLVNFPDCEKTFTLLSESNLDFGWHFNLTEGSPVSPPEKIKSLVQKDGNFYSLAQLIKRSLLKQIRPEDVKRELEAQWKIFENYRMIPSHVDGHQHIHLLPQITQPFLDFVAQKKIPFVRLPLESGGSRFLARSFLKLLFFRQKKYWKQSSARILPFYGLSLGKNSGNLEAWRKLLNRIEEPCAEIMVHPGYTNQEDCIQEQRIGELELLCSREFRILVQEMGFTPTNFRK